MRCALTGLLGIDRRLLAAPILLVLALTTPLIAYDDFSKQQPAPRPELAPGANLYWHQPGSWWKESCDDVIQTDWFGCLPHWYAQADLQVLRRDNLRSFDFASFGERGPRTLSSGGLDDQFKGGTRILVGMSLGDWYRLEGSYYGAFHWSDSSALRNIDPNGQNGFGNLMSPFSDFGNPPVPGIDFNNFAMIRLSSELDNVELNLRRRIALPPGPFEASFLVGVRYTRLDEDFTYTTDSGIPLPGGTLNDVVTRTKNEMIGIQIGMLTQWLVHPRSWIDFEVKGAAYSNAAQLHTDFINVDENGVATQYLGQDDKTVTSGILELSLLLNHQFTRTLTFRLGYSAMWFGGVALAPDNFVSSADLLQLGPVQINDKGRAVYHGPVIGLVGAW
jgi:hypothetical protein